jgi:glycosyltransferase involved in cell wall biosynthesis
VSQRVLIVSQGSHGHRLVYVALIANGLLTAGDEVVLALTAEGARSQEFNLHVKGLNPAPHVVTLPTGTLTWRALRDLCVREGCDRIILPDGDRWAMRLGLSLRRDCRPPVHVLVTQDPAWSTRSDLPSRFRMHIKSRLIRRAASRQSATVLRLRNPGDLDAGPNTVQDPVIGEPGETPVPELRARLGMDEPLYWFVVAGYISARKCPDMVLEAVLQLPTGRAGLLFAGEFDELVLKGLDQLRSQAAEQGVPVLVPNQLLSNEDINRAIEAADAVVVAYTTDSPNSMMAKGLRLGRTVIVAGSRSLQQWAVQLGVPLIGGRSVHQLRDLMEQAMRLPLPAPRDDLGSETFWRAFQ